MIIPDELSLGLVGLGLLTFWVNPNFSGSILNKFFYSFLGVLTGFILLWVLAEAGEKIFKKEAMGGGDLKLMMGIGALLGWQGVISTLMIGSLFGAVYGVSLIIIGKKRRDSTIPFGPFLSLGAIVNLYQFIPLSAFMVYF